MAMGVDVKARHDDDRETERRERENRPRQVVAQPREGVFRVGARRVDGVALDLLELADDGVGELIGRADRAASVRHPEGPRRENHHGERRQGRGGPGR